MCFRLSICRWHFGNQKNLDRMFVRFSGEESFETNLIDVSFCFCHDRLYFCVRMPLSTYCFNEFGFVLQLGKIVASIEQKPVSLDDICDV